MEILKFLSKEEKQRIKKINIDLEFGDEESELFFKWVYHVYELNINEFKKVIPGKVLTIKDGLFFFDNSKNGVKPIRCLNQQSNYLYEIFSLTKVKPEYNFLSGLKILDGYNKDSSQVKSCMSFTKRDSVKINKLQFYTKNKNISLFVVRENKKIVARSLVWKSGNNLFHDRLYYYNPLWKYFMEMIFDIKKIKDIDDSKVKIKLHYIPTFKIIRNNKTYNLLDVNLIPYLDNMSYISFEKKTLNNYNTNKSVSVVDFDCEDLDERLTDLISEYSF
jgi:hypothetical protein